MMLAAAVCVTEAVVASEKASSADVAQSRVICRALYSSFTLECRTTCPCWPSPQTRCSRTLRSSTRTHCGEPAAETSSAVCSDSRRKAGRSSVMASERARCRHVGMASLTWHEKEAE
eukprot:878421-Rhodomonas_salina.2